MASSPVRSWTSGVGGWEGIPEDNNRDRGIRCGSGTGSDSARALLARRRKKERPAGNPKNIWMWIVKSIESKRSMLGSISHPMMGWLSAQERYCALLLAKAPPLNLKVPMWRNSDGSRGKLQSLGQRCEQEAGPQLSPFGEENPPKTLKFKCRCEKKANPDLLEESRPSVRTATPGAWVLVYCPGKILVSKTV